MWARDLSWVYAVDIVATNVSGVTRSSWCVCESEIVRKESGKLASLIITPTEGRPAKVERDHERRGDSGREADDEVDLGMCCRLPRMDRGR